MLACLAYAFHLWDSRESLLKIRARLGRKVTHIDTNKHEKERKTGPEETICFLISCKKPGAGRPNRS